MTKKDSEIYLRTQLKYALTSSIIMFIIGGFLSIFFKMAFPEDISLSGFITTGSFILIVYWSGIISARYIIHFYPKNKSI